MYRPIFRPQYPDPTTTLDWYNCTMSSGAMALDFHTQGKEQVWGGTLRTLSGDTSGGTNIDNLQTAVGKLGGYKFEDHRGEPWANVVTALKAGKGVILQGDYDVFTGMSTCQSSFDGDHAIYLNPEFNSTKTAVLVGDPLCKTWKYIPLTTLRAYTEKLSLRVVKTTSKLYFATTRAWPETAGGVVDIMPTFKVVTTLPVGTLFVKDVGTWYLRLRDNKLLGPVGPTNWLPDGKFPILPVRLDLPIVAGMPLTDDWRLGYIIGEDPVFILNRNVTVKVPVATGDGDLAAKVDTQAKQIVLLDAAVASVSAKVKAIKDFVASA